MRDFKSFSNQFFSNQRCWNYFIYFQSARKSFGKSWVPPFLFFLTNEKFPCDSIQNKQNQKKFFLCFLFLNFEKTTLINFFKIQNFIFKSVILIESRKVCSYSNNTLLKKKKKKIKAKTINKIFDPEKKKKKKSWPKKKILFRNFFIDLNRTDLW